MKRALTAKQKKFAALLADGASKVEAYRAAYPGGPRTKGTEWVQAKRTARVPRVAAEVERLTVLNVAGQADKVATRLVGLIQDPDPGTAMKAITQWAKLAEAGLLKPPDASRDAEKKRIINELIAVYDEALNGQAQRDAAIRELAPIIVQPGDESAIVDADCEELGPVSLEEEPPVRSLAAATEHDRAILPKPPQVSETSALETDTYEWKCLPGYFGKPRRVLVRVR